MIDARTLDNGEILAADICIVGAGAAGISMALEFIDSGLNILLLESGGTKSDKKKPTTLCGNGSR